MSLRPLLAVTASVLVVVILAVAILMLWGPSLPDSGNPGVLP